MNPKSPKTSTVVMNELVFPTHINLLNQLMGGHLMHWMDIVSALSAHKHAQRAVVTASVDNISFKHPIALGHLVSLQAQVTRAFKTSMEVFIQVHAEDLHKGERFESNTAFFTFVALDADGHPVQVPTLVPETEEEKKMYEEALQRRRLRLLVAKKSSEAIDKLLGDH